MTKQDIDEIIKTVCPDDEDSNEPIISPAYLKKELEALAIEQDIFGTRMTVGEAIALLSYGANFELKGAYSGKIYHRSWNNNKKNIEKYLNEITADNPYYTKLVIDKEGDYCRPIIGIWMHDYEICKEKGLGNE